MDISAMAALVLGAIVAAVALPLILLKLLQAHGWWSEISITMSKRDMFKNNWKIRIKYWVLGLITAGGVWAANYAGV